MSGLDPFDLADFRRRVENIVRRGRVHSVDTAAARVKVDLGENLVTDWLPFFATRAGQDRTWWAPSLGEQVVVFSESGETTNGVVLTSIYQSDYPHPEHDAAKAVVRFKDGTVISYDHDANSFTIDVSPASGSITIKAGAKVTVRAPEALVDAARVDLGGENGKRIARVGDRVMINAGSSAGLNGVIHEGSEIVHAVD